MRRLTPYLFPLLISVAAGCALAHYPIVDWAVYRNAGAAFLIGNWEQVYQIEHVTPFKYHPVFAFVAAAFALPSPPDARMMWIVANAAILFDTQRRWISQLGLNPVAIAVAALVLYHAFEWQCRLGNVTFAMLWVWTVAFTTRHAWIEAFCYAFLIALKPFWIAMAVPWILCRRWRLIAWTGLFLLALCLAPLLAGTEFFTVGYLRWYETFTAPIHDRNLPKIDNQTWYAWLYRANWIDESRLVAWWVAGSAVAGVVWLGIWARALMQPGTSRRQWRLEHSAMPFVLWAAPMSWIHHQLLLWPLLALIAQRARQEWPARLVLVVAAVVFSVFSQTVLGRSTAFPLLRAGWPLVGMWVLLLWSAWYFRADELADADDLAGKPLHR